jgi:ABC-type Fe3+-hydroxamate transport system substrate-binding protein
MKKICCSFMLLFMLCVVSNPASLAHADDAITLSKGQTIYVPCYSHIYAGSRELQVLLTVTISIRNIDPKQTITITSADYYGTKGELLKKYLSQAVVLGPFESTRYVIAQKDKSGGSGANFLVTWKSAKPVNPPLMESIMIGAERQLGISFTSRGQVITTAD